MWNVGGMGVNYGSAANGRLWSAASNPAQVGADWIGNTVFNEQAPILVFRNPSGSGVRANMIAVSLFVTNLAGGNVHFRVMSDRIDRYVTLSGTAHSNGNADSVMVLPTTVGRPAKTSALVVYDELAELEAATFTNTMNRSDIIGTTLAVAGSPQEIDYGVLPAGSGNSGVFSFNGSLVIEPNTVAMVYAWAVTTAPQGRFAARWTEELLNVS